MNKSWNELAAALDAILPSESNRENTLGTIAHNLPLRSLEQETIVLDKDLKNGALRVFLESEEDNFHPADVVLGFVPRLAMNYFPSTLIYRQRARAYEHMCGGSYSTGRDDFGLDEIFCEIFDPVITMEEYADQLIDSVQKQGGRFLRLDPSSPGVKVLDRELARVITVNYIARTNLRRSQILSQRKRWIPNKVNKRKANDTFVKDTKTGLSKQSRASKIAAFKVKTYGLTKAILKSSDQHRNPHLTPLKPSQTSTCSRFRLGVPHADHEE